MEMDDQRYSYFQPSFVDFYDTMVETCFGGIHSPDMIEFSALFHQRLKSSPSSSSFRTVDLGTGTGRCILALLHNLPVEAEQNRDLHFLGLDNSDVMIQRAREKIETSNKRVTVDLRVQSLEAWNVPEWHEGVDLILAAAGPFHHLLSEEALLMALKQIHLHLKGNGQGLAVINLLSSDELFHREVEGAMSEEAFKVGPYRRWRVQHEMKEVDGARVMHEKFRLCRVSAEEEEKVEWEEWEEWTLREVDEEKLVLLAARVGLVQVNLEVPCKKCVALCRKQ